MARIAYASSDVVLSVQPALGVDSEFSRQLHSLAAKRIPGVIGKEPEVSCFSKIRTREPADPSPRCKQYGTTLTPSCLLFSPSGQESLSRLRRLHQYCYPRSLTCISSLNIQSSYMWLSIPSDIQTTPRSPRYDNVALLFCSQRLCARVRI